MQALVYTKDKELPKLQQVEVPLPAPKDNEILIKVEASCLNNAEISKFRDLITAGKNILSLELTNETKPKANGKILGTDVAGVVVDVGSKVTKFKKGDQVFGITGYFYDAWAEYSCLAEKNAALKPSNLSFEESAAIPTTGGTALAALRKAAIKPKQKVLVNGATGGVGLFVLQMAKNAGAYVTAVCSTKNIELVKKYGANEVVDYQQEDVTAQHLKDKYDVIIVINGYHPISDYQRILRYSGHLVIIGGKFSQTVSAMLLGPLMTLGRKKQIGATSLIALRGNWMSDLAEMAEKKQIQPYLDHVFSWNEIDQALEYAIKEHTKGKVAIKIGVDK